jgi:hypothetical protein
MNQLQPPTPLLLYQTEDGQTRIQLRTKDGSIWLSQKEIADLFDSTVSNVNKHINSISTEGELNINSVIEESSITAADGKNYPTKLYRLDMILAIGYRVKSHRGTQFRRWATEHLKTYLTQGFLLDDERFKAGKDDEYFEALLARIRDIRSSEKVFWKKVLDIYATSVDYDPKIEASQQFFATVQNKMHWAAHGHTAAEVIALRANASLPSMGLTSWAGQSKGGLIRKTDVGVAKNYLAEDELASLNRMVTAYIEIAQIQAQARVAMTMQDWAARLDDFLRMTMKDVLTHAGKVSAEVALLKAHDAFDAYHAEQINAPSQVERDFEAALEHSIQRLEKK